MDLVLRPKIVHVHMVQPGGNHVGNAIALAEIGAAPSHSNDHSEIAGMFDGPKQRRLVRIAADDDRRRAECRAPKVGRESAASETASTDERLQKTASAAAVSESCAANGPTSSARSIIG